MRNEVQKIMFYGAAYQPQVSKGTTEPPREFIIPIAKLPKSMQTRENLKKYDSNENGFIESDGDELTRWQRDLVKAGSKIRLSDYALKGNVHIEESIHYGQTNVVDKNEKLVAAAALDDELTILAYREEGAGYSDFYKTDLQGMNSTISECRVHHNVTYKGEGGFEKSVRENKDGTKQVEYTKGRKEYNVDFSGYFYNNYKSISIIYDQNDKKISEREEIRPGDGDSWTITERSYDSNGKVIGYSKETANSHNYSRTIESPFPEITIKETDGVQTYLYNGRPATKESFLCDTEDSGTNEIQVYTEQNGKKHYYMCNYETELSVEKETNNSIELVGTSYDTKKGKTIYTRYSIVKDTDTFIVREKSEASLPSMMLKDEPSESEKKEQERKQDLSNPYRFVLE